MKLIQQITDNPLQKQRFTLDDGTAFTFTLYFISLQQGWFFTNITYGTFILNGLRITNSINMLNQFINIIPFGISCVSTANREPSLQQDFSSASSKLYVMNHEECVQYAEYLKLA